ncbi:chromosome segregation protein SMC [Candidatus Bipolaricaulota bacterium]|nr:chromosome segregation protein SMC [Candidatus Bipolaricaulota bacterium]
MSTAIKRLEIQGFKSFRKRVVLPFYPGFTAIVGENGTGKSNIFDALAFVMGRRSRSLRAERVEQLLHAPPGGEPVQEAVVSLTLDNSSGLFDELLPAPAKEVVLSRRITPDSSTYRLQGRPVPAKAVEGLLSLAKIDPSGYHIVEQGMVIDVLERSPKRRREILDEVAGIAAYEERKAKAISELAQVKERLNTSRILLAERRHRLAELHREREAALEHRALTEERDRLAASLAFHRWQSLSRSLERAQARAEQTRGEVEELAREVDRLDREIELQERELGERAPAQDEEMAELIRAVEGLRGKLSAKEAEARALERELNSLRDSIEELKRFVGLKDRVPEPVAAILGLGWEGIHGTVGQLVRPEEGLELAFETALGGHRHDLVVESRALALECVRYLKQEGLGRARLLPLDRLAVPRISPKAREALRLPGVMGLAIELCQFPPRVRDAVAYVLADTLVAETLEAVRELFGVRVVTLDGDLLERGGAIVGGAPRKGGGPDLSGKLAHLARVEGELRAARQEIERLSAELSAAEARLSEHSRKMAQRKAARSAAEQGLLELRQRRKELYLALERKRASLSRYEREAAELRGELAALGEVPQPPGGTVPGTPDVLQARLRQVERRLAELGPVNLRAIEEYEAFLVEFQAFKERVRTLEREKHEIEHFIGELEKKKREKFLVTLETVSAELDRIFKRLFGGGEAGLKLAEEGNIDSGLLVYARPPGKEPRLLDALSGGEKTLVAIAFVLALAAGRPAPFYLLDEVDAALDRANSERLAALLRDFAKKSQVIVISHNEELVRFADRVYGVTMRDGTSSVVALELVSHGAS